MGTGLWLQSLRIGVLIGGVGWRWARSAAQPYAAISRFLVAIVTGRFADVVVVKMSQYVDGTARIISAVSITRASGVCRTIAVFTLRDMRASLLVA